MLTFRSGERFEEQQVSRELRYLTESLITEVFKRPPFAIFDFVRASGTFDGGDSLEVGAQSETRVTCS